MTKLLIHYEIGPFKLNNPNLSRSTLYIGVLSSFQYWVLLICQLCWPSWIPHHRELHCRTWRISWNQKRSRGICQHPSSIRFSSLCCPCQARCCRCPRPATGFHCQLLRRLWPCRQDHLPADPIHPADCLHHPLLLVAVSYSPACCCSYSCTCSPCCCSSSCPCPSCLICSRCLWCCRPEQRPRRDSQLQLQLRSSEINTIMQCISNTSGHFDNYFRAKIYVVLCYLFMIKSFDYSFNKLN